MEAQYRREFSDPRPRDLPLSEIGIGLAGIPLLFQPGTQWRYGMATDVLGQGIQVMNDTAFVVRPDKRDRLAPVYSSSALSDPAPVLVDAVFWIGDGKAPRRFSAPGSCPRSDPARGDRSERRGHPPIPVAEE